MLSWASATPNRALRFHKTGKTAFTVGLWALSSVDAHQSAVVPVVWFLLCFCTFSQLIRELTDKTQASFAFLLPSFSIRTFHDALISSPLYTYTANGAVQRRDYSMTMLETVPNKDEIRNP